MANDDISPVITEAVSESLKCAVRERGINPPCKIIIVVGGSLSYWDVLDDESETCLGSINVNGESKKPPDRVRAILLSNNDSIVVTFHITYGPDRRFTLIRGGKE